MGGFLPTDHAGVVTKVDGRVIHEIDGRPAAEVYDAWTGGAIRQALEDGGNVLSKTNMRPLSRCVGSAMGMPRRILSHPHQVLAGSRALTFFTEFSRSDRLTLMTSTGDPMVSRVRRAVERARGSLVGPPRADHRPCRRARHCLPERPRPAAHSWRTAGAVPGGHSRDSRGEA